MAGGLVRRLPLAVRLAAAAAFAVTALLAVVGMFVYSALAHNLATALDLQLRQQVQDLAAGVTAGGPPLSSAQPARSIEFGETFAEVLDSRGRVLDATPSLQRVALLRAPQVQMAIRDRELFVDRSSVAGLDEPVRMLAVALQRKGQPIVLVAGATAQNRAEALANVRNRLLIGGPPTVLLLTVGAYLLARAALRPVEEMRARAATISATTPGERLPLRDSGDEISRLGVTLNDMLGRLEQGLQRERDFVARASHELRTPLALLKTELELALRRPRSSAHLESAIRSAMEETDRLAMLADDLLFLARGDNDALAISRQPVDIDQLVRRVCHRFASRAADTGRAIEVASGACSLDIDPVRIEQAVTNLIDNALTHGAGDVSVSLTVDRTKVLLTIADHGRGFPPDLVPHAFDRFVRRRAVGRGGAGLGLSIVAAIAHAHGGEVTASNQPERGATVTLSLPRARQGLRTS